MPAPNRCGPGPGIGSWYSTARSWSSAGKASVMELQHLKTLLAVAEAGSLTRAAETLYISQPAVSAQIKALEIELGVQLFRRTARGMTLTHAGEEILATARGVIDGAEAVTRTAERLRGDVAGTLRLGTVDCGYPVKLARMIGMMSLRHPDLEVNVVTANSGDHRRSVLDQEIDAACIEGWFEDDRLESVRLGTSRLGVIGPAAWENELAGESWPDLAARPWVFQSKTCSYCALMERIGEEQHLRFNPQLRVEAMGAIKDLVAEGLALSITDLDDAAPQIEAGELCVWPGFEFQMPVRLIMMQQRAEEPMLRSLAEVAREVHHGNTRRKAKTDGFAGNVKL